MNAARCRRVLLLLPTTTYKSADFLAAAERLGVRVVVGTDRRQALEDRSPAHNLTIDLSDPQAALAEILGHAPFDAVVGSDDETVVLAAWASKRLGLPHNDVAAVQATRDKHELRSRLRRAGLRCPDFRRIPAGQPASELAASLRYPCVVKPLSMAASRGVLRADDAGAFAEALRRVRAIEGNAGADLLVEDYLPGEEVAVEGLLTGGRLRILALFDKPDPLEGPTFEETLYVTPSRHPAALRQAIREEVARGVEAVGLTEGPVHAELRLSRGEPWILEIAARSIGGLCSRALRFGASVSLEELILRNGLRIEPSAPPREDRAAGVMMIPIPRAGILRGVRGLARARAVPGIEELTLSVRRGARVVPLPEGRQYLGFIFARGDDPAAVESTLREAHACLVFSIES